MATAVANGGEASSSSSSTKRVSYILPPIQHVPRLLRLPSIAANQDNLRGRSGPLLLPSGNIVDQTNTQSSQLRSSSHAGSDSNHPRHTLPVTSLAIDTSTILADSKEHKPSGILYTGGRDGLIGAWELGLRLRRKKAVYRYDGVEEEEGENDEDEEEEEEEEEATMGLLDGISPSTSVGNTQWEVDNEAGEDAVSAPAAKFRQCLGSHTDWINDIVLCNQNQTVVSASSDRSIKIWNPHDPSTSMIPHTLGTHKDYVRALALAPKANWVASGSFDKTIKVWDLKEMRETPIFTIAEPALCTSIYALAVNTWGTVMAAASPEKTIQLWDPRSRQQISQLIGHRDNVRSVVLSRDGSHLLSASSDSTIKLWSLGEQRCLHTFTHHNDSVWSLFSNHDSLDVFYSGDRSGILCKVDWERCAEVSEGECVVIAKEKIDEGESKFNRGCPSDAKAAGIYKIVALDNSYIWTANSSSVVNRYKDVQPRWKREALFPIQSDSDPVKQIKTTSSIISSSMIPPRPSALKSHGGSFNLVQTSVSFAEDTDSSLLTPGSPNTPTNSDTMHDDRGNQAATLYGLPFASLVCLAPPNDPFGAAIGLGSTSMRTLDRRDSVTSPSPANAMFSSASLISIPSVLKAAQQESVRPYSPQGETSLGYSPAGFATYHARYLDTGARPSSTRSASIRFAPLAALQNSEDINSGSFQEYDHVDVDHMETNRGAHEAREAFEERDSAVDAIPLRTAAEDAIHSSHGLIRCSMLNDRRHVLAIDSAGQIFLWDIVSGKCLGGFDWGEVSQAWSHGEGSSTESNLLPGDALDIVKERIQGEGITPMWCTVDTRVGSLSVHLDPNRCFDAEIYLDEMTDVLVQHDATFDGSKDDTRINVARLVLRNLFDGFINEEAKLRGQGDAASGLRKGQLAMEKSNIVNKKPNLKLELGRRVISDEVESSQTPGMTVALAVAAKTPAILPLVSPLTPQSRVEMPSMHQLLKSDRNATPGGTGTASQAVMDDYFSISNNNGPSDAKPQTPQPKTPSAAVASPTSPGGSGLMGRLRMSIKGKKEEKNASTANSNTAAAAEAQEEEKANQQEGKNRLDTVRKILTMSNPSKVIEDMPRIPFPPQTAIMISEASSDSVDYHVDYLGLEKTTKVDVAKLEIIAPEWLLEFLLGASDYSAPLNDKITFLLVPWEDSATKTKDAKVETMPAMPTGNSRLTATKMLRVKKACTYVAEKLEIIEDSNFTSTSVGVKAKKIASSNHMSNRVDNNGSNSVEIEAHDAIELLCNGIAIPANCTLAQIQRFYWKSSNILRLDYRWRLV